MRLCHLLVIWQVLLVTSHFWPKLSYWDKPWKPLGLRLCHLWVDIESQCHIFIKAFLLGKILETLGKPLGLRLCHLLMIWWLVLLTLNPNVTFLTKAFFLGFMVAAMIWDWILVLRKKWKVWWRWNDGEKRPTSKTVQEYVDQTIHIISSRVVDMYLTFYLVVISVQERQDCCSVWPQWTCLWNQTLSSSSS